MTPVRAAAIVRGDVPGLLRRGMPVVLHISIGDNDGVSRIPGVVSSVTVDEHGDVDTVAYYDDPRIGRGRYYGASVTVDWTDPLAIYAALHWLADRGHLCGWMLPTTHGGRVEAWDGLSAWDVAAVLVSVSVGRVAAGIRPVRMFYADINDLRRDYNNPHETIEDAVEHEFAIGVPGGLVVLA